MEKNKNDDFAPVEKTQSFGAGSSRSKILTKPKDTSNKIREHYHFAGKLIKELNVWRLVSIFLMILVLALLVYSITLSTRKMPVVVIDGNGASIIKTPQSDNFVSDPELLYVTKMFVKPYCNLNYLTVEEDIKISLNYMSQEMRNKYNKELKDENFIKRVKEAKITPVIKLGPIKITSRKHPYYETSLSVERIVNNIDREHIFTTLTIKRFQRNAEFRPSGLWIVNVKKYETDQQDEIKKTLNY